MEILRLKSQKKCHSPRNFSSSGIGKVEKEAEPSKADDAWSKHFAWTLDDHRGADHYGINSKMSTSANEVTAAKPDVDKVALLDEEGDLTPEVSCC